MRLFLLLNLRRLVRQPVRTVLGAVAAAAGVALVVSVAVTTTSVSRSFAASASHVGGPAPLRVVGATSRGGLAASVLSTVKRTPGVCAGVRMVRAATLGDRGPGAPGGARTVTGQTGSSGQP